MIETIAQLSNLGLWAGLGALFTLLGDVVLGVLAIFLAFT
jgi:hypothetical protein